MKKRAIICFFISIMVAVYALGIPVAAAQPSLDAVQTGCNTLDAKNPTLSGKVVLKNVQAALLYEVNTDTLLYVLNADTPMYPSSLTKIMTALLVLEKGTLTDLVTIRQDVLDTVPPGAASAKLVDQEVLSVEQLLYCMLVDSANDAAAVLADHIGGTQDNFIQMMNTRAQELGCTGTNFVNVHGLYAENHLSTARDIAKILNQAIQNETFVEIFGTTYKVLPATNKTEERGLVSGNYLMTRGNLQIYYDSRVTGGRTALADDDIRSIATTSERNGMKMICIIMGSEDKMAEDETLVAAYGSFSETTELLDYGYSGMAATQVLYNGQALKQYKVSNGECDVVVGPDITVDAVLPANITKNDLTFRYNDLSATLTAPIEKGQKISNVEVFYSGVCLAQADLYAMNSVAIQEQSFDADAQMEPGTVKGILLGVAAALAAVVLLFFGSRYLRYVRLQRRRKKINSRHRRGY